MSKPYIGVTGFMTQAEVQVAIDAYRAAWGDTEPTHQLMVGVLASDKTLAGKPNKWPRRYPPIEGLANIFPNEEEEDFPTLKLIHYAGDKSLASLAKLADLGGAFYDGFQFNGEWPEPEVLYKLFDQTGEQRVVLQVGSALLNEHASTLAKKLVPYVDVVTDVLLDASSGKGIPMDSERIAWGVAWHASFIAQEHPKIGVGFAGGFCAEAITPTVGKLLRAGCSIDAEGRLRDDAEGGGNLNLDAMRRYLQAAVASIRSTV